MGIEGFNQVQYLQLALDVRYGNSPPRPSFIIRLPLSPHKLLRKRESISSASETDNDELGADEVFKFHPLSRVTRFRPNYTKKSRQEDHATAHRQRQRSKRRHRSGPGEDYGVPSKSHFSSLTRNMDLQIRLLTIN